MLPDEVSAVESSPDAADMSDAMLGGRSRVECECDGKEGCCNYNENMAEVEQEEDQGQRGGGAAEFLCGSVGGLMPSVLRFTNMSEGH